MTTASDGAELSTEKTSHKVTLGRVVAIVDDVDNSGKCRATVDVGSATPLSFFSNERPTFQAGDLVVVSDADDDQEQIAATEWLAMQNAGLWRLCSDNEFGAKRASRQVLVVQPGMQLRQSCSPAHYKSRASAPQDSPRFDMLIVPTWAAGD